MSGWRSDVLQTRGEERLAESTANIIAGTDDVMHAGAAALHAQLPQSRFVSIEGAPHDSVNARPDAFNQAVKDFVDAVENRETLAGHITL